MKRWLRAVQANTDIVALVVLVLVFTFGGDRTLSRVLRPVLDVRSYAAPASRAALHWEQAPKLSNPCLSFEER